MERSQEIKPIETKYDGYRFRSRLEARWAVFFNACGIKYQYEPDGFEVDGYKYLPDFYLPDFDVYAEVKPNVQKLLEEKVKISKMIDYQSTPISKGLLILGQIPYYESIKSDLPGVPFLYWDEGVACGAAYFIKISKRAKAIIRFDTDYGFCSSEPDLPFIIRDDDNLIHHRSTLVMRDYVDVEWYLSIKSKDAIMEVMKPAYDAARYARFEHGETPTIKSAKFNK